MIVKFIIHNLKLKNQGKDKFFEY